MPLWTIHNNEPVGSKLKHPGAVLVFLYCHIVSGVSQLNLKANTRLKIHRKGFCHLIPLEHLTHVMIVYQVLKDFQSLWVRTCHGREFKPCREGRQPLSTTVTTVVRDLKDVQRGEDGRSLLVRCLVSVIEGSALLG